MGCIAVRSDFFFFNDTATTEIYTLSLHDALPISRLTRCVFQSDGLPGAVTRSRLRARTWRRCTLPGAARRLGRSHSIRSEEHTSELQSQSNLVCRLLLEKKNNQHHHVDVQLPRYQ